MEIEELYQKYLSTGIVSTDTRRITKGCMFLALKGDNFNGNEFAMQALESGASVSVVDEKEFALDDRCI